MLDINFNGLSPRAKDVVRAVQALRRLPTDTTKAQENALTRAFRNINTKEQTIVALILAEQNQEVSRG